MRAGETKDLASLVVEGEKDVRSSVKNGMEGLNRELS